MKQRNKALAGVAILAFLAGCSMFKSDNSSPSASSSSSTTSSSDVAANTTPSTTPSASEPLAKTSPVEGGAPATGATAVAPGGAAPVAIAIAEVQNPKTTLAHATVKDVKGEAVGEVKSVRIAKDGKVAAINVTVGKRTYALKADTLTYMQAENTIVSQQSKSEITKTH